MSIVPFSVLYLRQVHCSRSPTLQLLEQAGGVQVCNGYHKNNNTLHPIIIKNYLAVRTTRSTPGTTHAFSVYCQFCPSIITHYLASLTVLAGASNLISLLQYFSSRLNHSKLNVEVSTHTTKPQNKADHDYDLPTSFIIVYVYLCFNFS